MDGEASPLAVSVVGRLCSVETPALLGSCRRRVVVNYDATFCTRLGHFTPHSTPSIPRFHTFPVAG